MVRKVCDNDGCERLTNCGAKLCTECNKLTEEYRRAHIDQCAMLNRIRNQRKAVYNEAAKEDLTLLNNLCPIGEQREVRKRRVFRISPLRNVILTAEIINELQAVADRHGVRIKVK